MNKTIAMHVRYNPWYISSPSSAKQQPQILPCLENVNHTAGFLTFFSFF